MATPKPYSLQGDPDASTVEQIDEMFEILFRDLDDLIPADGVDGQVLTSQGPDTDPEWETLPSSPTASGPMLFDETVVDEYPWMAPASTAASNGTVSRLLSTGTLTLPDTYCLVVTDYYSVTGDSTVLNLEGDAVIAVV
jgi:hypothetical protein